jgi:hypothetical protein
LNPRMELSDPLNQCFRELDKAPWDSKHGSITFAESTGSLAVYSPLLGNPAFA